MTRSVFKGVHENARSTFRCYLPKQAKTVSSICLVFKVFKVFKPEFVRFLRQDPSNSSLTAFLMPFLIAFLQCRFFVASQDKRCDQNKIPYSRTCYKKSAVNQAKAVKRGAKTFLATFDVMLALSFENLG